MTFGFFILHPRALEEHYARSLVHRRAFDKTSFDAPAKKLRLQSTEPESLVLQNDLVAPKLRSD
jgi:hypothetical protein